MKKILPPVKRKYLIGMSLFGCLALLGAAFFMPASDGFDTARREILLRRIGHEVLLQSGDSVSRVLPVKKAAKNEYQLRFENSFAFKPDVLVNTTQRWLAGDPLLRDYVVEVLNCADASVAYGYAVSGNTKDDIVACIGRTQPVACYRINIKFKPAPIITAKQEYLLGALPFLALICFLFFRPARPGENTPARSDSGVFAFGSIRFDPEARRLMWDGGVIELTKTEARVLRIFALCPNEPIERSRLQKEIWEDEGVIVGRSLDMFISKLRKKLEADPHVRIVAIRGKGYKLEVGV